MEATQAIETKLAQASAFDSPIDQEHDIERMTKNVQGRTAVTLIPRPSNSPRDPLVSNVGPVYDTICQRIIHVVF